MHNSKILQGLNEAQREAVLHGEGPALVAAGPGSGKTFTITRRLLYLIQERNVPPEKILVITFTKEAAKTMQERFLEELRRHQITQNNSKGFVSFGTFHSFFYQIIKQIPKYKEYQLITQQEKIKIAKEILNKENSEEVTETEIRQFLMCVSFFKNTGEVKLTSSKTVDVEIQEQTKEFLKQFEAYESRKRSYRRLDFDDMLYMCREELEKSKEILRYWQSRFSYILVDEAQDMNSMQYRLLKLLAVSPYNFFLVGDDDQAIYSFRGSDSKVFQKFVEDYPHTVQICLNRNYRCAEMIVNASKRIIEKNKHRVLKELVSESQMASKGKIQAYGSVNNKESYNRVIEALKRVQEAERNQYAVLFRTNFAMQTFASCLTGCNIPFVMREKISSIYEHFVVKDVFDFFCAASGNRERSLFLRIFQKLQIPLGRESLRKEQVSLTEVKKCYREGFYENKFVYEEIEALERHLNRLAQMSPGLGMKYILHAMGYQNYLFRKCSKNREIIDEWQRILEWLAEDAKDFCDFKSWDKHIQVCKKELEKNTDYTQEKNGIHLLTLHAAKGLEFQKVYIMNLNEGTIPQFRRGEAVTEERLEEERRLFYVGMTRAKEELELHYITGTKENPRFRSRFLEELGYDNGDIHENDAKYCVE